LVYIYIVYVYVYVISRQVNLPAMHEQAHIKQAKLTFYHYHKGFS